jgi:hypothetical protein
LTHNNISNLPSNLIQFTSLKVLNLSGNTLNSDSVFFSLATLPALTDLNLDDNQIMEVPKLAFGFEALAHLTLKSNKIETPDDIEALADLDALTDVDICQNPLVLRIKQLAAARALFENAHIALITHPPETQKKSVLTGPLRTVPFDPLTLPSFAPGHYRALNQKSPERAAPEPEKPKPPQDLFITGFESKDGRRVEPPAVPSAGEQFSNIWADVPIAGLEKRLKLTPRTRHAFDLAFGKLCFLVDHPELRINPKESPSTEPPPAREPAEAPEPPARKRPKPGAAKSTIAWQLAARTEYTKTEIQEMLQSMEQRLTIVERDLGAADQSGERAVDIVLDQKNFAFLHKQYETIRAELINTLNS